MNERHGKIRRFFRGPLERSRSCLWTRRGQLWRWLLWRCCEPAFRQKGSSKCPKSAKKWRPCRGLPRRKALIDFAHLRPRFRTVCSSMACTGVTHFVLTVRKLRAVKKKGQRGRPGLCKDKNGFLPAWENERDKLRDVKGAAWQAARCFFFTLVVLWEFSKWVSFFVDVEFYSFECFLSILSVFLAIVSVFGHFWPYWPYWVFRKCWAYLGQLLITNFWKILSVFGNFWAFLG